MFEQVTKFQGRPRTADELPATVSRAIRSMLTGRNRPAYVELPTDLLVKPLSGPPDDEPVAPAEAGTRPGRGRARSRDCCRRRSGR